MKKTIVILLLITISLTAYTQDELNARVELENAESAQNEENYEKALSHLNKTQEHLGSWSGRISYLKIIALDALCDYEKTDNSILPLLETEVGLYKEYTKKNPDKIDIDKYKDIKKAEEKIISAKQMKAWKEMPEYTTAKEYYKKKDYTEAMLWYQKAEEKGNVMATNNIGNMYIYGTGVTKNVSEGLKKIKNAAEKGDIEAMQWFGLIYRHEKFNKGIVGTDYAEAMKWYKMAIDKGSTSAMTSIGNIYKQGHGVSTDYAEAMKWYKMAGHKKDAFAMHSIGIMYERGEGIAQDYTEAMKWLKKAADSGIVDAMLEVGSMYNEGKGVPQNTTEAKRWFKKVDEWIAAEKQKK